MGKTWMPIAAGILDIIFCCPVLLYLIFAVLWGSAEGTWYVAAVLQFVTAFALVGLAFVGAAYAMGRRKWKLALAGSISAFLPVAAGSIYVILAAFDSPISTFIGFGIIVLFSTPIALTAISKNEFK
ncbi:MAG: hypothetical protein MUO97_00045 [Dehalococcoidia bacterium]|nr:hypothetical protein [Dehalococcoidia bacterium]